MTNHIITHVFIIDVYSHEERKKKKAEWKTTQNNFLGWKEWSLRRA